MFKMSLIFFLLFGRFALANFVECETTTDTFNKKSLLIRCVHKGETAIVLLNEVNKRTTPLLKKRDFDPKDKTPHLYFWRWKEDKLLCDARHWEQEKTENLSKLFSNEKEIEAVCILYIDPTTGELVNIPQNKKEKTSSGGVSNF